MPPKAQAFSDPFANVWADGQVGSPSRGGMLDSPGQRRAASLSPRNLIDTQEPMGDDDYNDQPHSARGPSERTKKMSRIAEQMYQRVTDDPMHHKHSKSKVVPKKSGFGGGGPGVKPMLLVCYLCGQQFGTKSLDIHQPQCYVKKLLQWERNSSDFRGQKPISPEEHEARLLAQGIDTSAAVGGGGGFGGGGGGFGGGFGGGGRDQFNEAQMAGYTDNLVACDNCGRTFLPDRLEIHVRSCKGPGRGSKPVARNRSSSPAVGRGGAGVNSVSPSMSPDRPTTPKKVIPKKAAAAGPPRQTMHERMSANLVPCSTCGRTFAPDRVEKHESVCQGTKVKSPGLAKAASFSLAKAAGTGKAPGSITPPPNRNASFSKLPSDYVPPHKQTPEKGVRRVSPQSTGTPKAAGAPKAASSAMQGDKLKTAIAKQQAKKASAGRRSGGGGTPCTPPVGVASPGIDELPDLDSFLDTSASFENDVTELHSSPNLRARRGQPGARSRSPPQAGLEAQANLEAQFEDLQAQFSEINTRSSGGGKTGTRGGAAPKPTVLSPAGRRPSGSMMAHSTRSPPQPACLTQPASPMVGGPNPLDSFSNTPSGGSEELGPRDSASQGGGNSEFPSGSSSLIDMGKPRFCGECGTRIGTEKQKFCMECGTKL